MCPFERNTIWLLLLFLRVHHMTMVVVDIVEILKRIREALNLGNGFAEINESATWSRSSVDDFSDMARPRVSTYTSCSRI